MKIYTLWHEGSSLDGKPWIMDAVDEHTLVSTPGFSDEYLETRDDPRVRELILHVSEDAVHALFTTPSVGVTATHSPDGHPLDGCSDPTCGRAPWCAGNDRALRGKPWKSK